MTETDNRILEAYKIVERYRGSALEQIENKAYQEELIRLAKQRGIDRARKDFTPPPRFYKIEWK